MTFSASKISRAAGGADLTGLVLANMLARLAKRTRSLAQVATLLARVSASEQVSFAARPAVQDALGAAERHLWSTACWTRIAQQPELGRGLSSRSYCTSR